MWAFRRAVNECKIPLIVSTRGIGKVYKKEINNFPVKTILLTNVIKNLSQDDVNNLIGRMSLENNKYFEEIKRLRLK